jgi:hypothetical protein
LKELVNQSDLTHSLVSSTRDHELMRKVAYITMSFFHAKNDHVPEKGPTSPKNRRRCLYKVGIGIAESMTVCDLMGQKSIEDYNVIPKV